MNLVHVIFISYLFHIFMKSQISQLSMPHADYNTSPCWLPFDLNLAPKSYKITKRLETAAQTGHSGKRQGIPEGNLAIPAIQVECQPPRERG